MEGLQLQLLYKYDKMKISKQSVLHIHTNTHTHARDYFVVKLIINYGKREPQQPFLKTSEFYACMIDSLDRTFFGQNVAVIDCK